MNQRSSAPARVFAAIALVCGVLVIAIVVVTSLGGDDGGGDSGSAHGGAAHHSGAKGHTPKAYVVQSGDTLTSIAHRTGVPVARIRALNPGIDPQILVSGEKLKLR
jgi:LysM repeat protein